MPKAIDKLTKRLKSKEIESKILKDLEQIKDDSKNQEEFLEYFESLLLRIFKIDFCFLLLKKNQQLSIKYTNYPYEYHSELILNLAQDLIDSNKYLVIGNTKRHKAIKKQKIKSLLAAGLKTKNQELAIILGGRKKRKFLKLEIKKLMTVIKGLVNSLEGLSLKEELGHKSKELEVIDRINHLRDTITDYDKLVVEILKEIKKEVNCGLSYFYLDGEETKFLVAGKPLQSDFIKDNKRKIIACCRKSTEEAKINNFGRLNEDIDDLSCVPFLVSQKSHGVLGVVNPRKSTKILSTIAKQVNLVLSENWKQSQIKNVFSNYVSPEIIEMMLRNKEKDYLQTKKEEITVLFSDIRGFTKLSEKVPPEKIVEMMNEHLNIMTEIILKNKGMVDKFIGDAIMAVWGVPVYQESHAFKAINAGFEMQKAQKKLERKYAKEGLKFVMGVGVNTGEAIVGNIGSNLKMDYTVIGDMVNTASRICGAADPGQVLISEDTFREAQKSVKTVKLEPISVKNKSKPLEIYEVLGIK